MPSRRSRVASKDTSLEIYEEFNPLNIGKRKTERDPRVYVDNDEESDIIFIFRSMICQ